MEDFIITVLIPCIVALIFTPMIVRSRANKYTNVRLELKQVFILLRGAIFTFVLMIAFFGWLMGTVDSSGDIGGMLMFFIFIIGWPISFHIFYVLIRKTLNKVGLSPLESQSIANTSVNTSFLIILIIWGIVFIAQNVVGKL